MRTLHTIFRCAAILSTISLCGCATILTGTKSKVRVDTKPPGALIQVDGLDKGQTPADISLKRGSSGQTITLSKKGYQTRSFEAETEFNPVSILNLFGLLAWGIDAASGALWVYKPTFYSINLEPAD